MSGFLIVVLIDRLRRVRNSPPLTPGPSPLRSSGARGAKGGEYLSCRPLSVASETQQGLFAIASTIWRWLALCCLVCSSIGIVNCSTLCLAKEQVDVAFNRDLEFDKRFQFKFDPKAARVDAQTVVVSWVGKPEKFPLLFAKTQFGIKGDFVVEYRFDGVQLGTPQSGYGSGALLRLEFVDGERTGVSLQRQCSTDGRQLINIDQTKFGQAEHQVTLIEVGQDEVVGLRIERTGSRLAVAGLTDGEPKLYKTVAVSTSPVFPIGFHVHSGDALADVQLNLRGMKIEADAFVDPKEFSGIKPSVKWAAAALSGLLLIMGVQRRMRKLHSTIGEVTG